MGKKINLGILFPDDDVWTGGKNYFLSLITSLKHLKLNQTNFTIISSNKNKQLFSQNNIQKKNVIFTNFFKNKSLLNFVRKIILFIIGKDLILNYFINSKKINIFSHYKPFENIYSICWIPDMQHIYIKKNFTKNEIIRRNLLFGSYVKYATKIVVSSFDTKKQLMSNYKNLEKEKVEILKFVPKINLKNINNLNLKKYNLRSEFFYIPNQFWPHKNHEILIKCAYELKKQNYFIQLVLSGDNSTNKEYFLNLFKKINNLGLSKYFNYLGMIPKNDVSKLIYKSKAVINPSLFEGWNTSVEEAKILKKKIILSDIAVHREQASKNSLFFKKDNGKQLAKTIMEIKSKKNENLKIIKKDYKNSRKKFAMEYLKIIKKAIAGN